MATECSALVKHCACGREHDVRGWRELPLAGYQETPRDGVWELRTCPCGATLAVQTPETIAVCRRCAQTEPLRIWRGLMVCCVCEYVLRDWAEQQEAYARAKVAERANAKRCA
jgi:hypothetical protein